MALPSDAKTIFQFLTAHGYSDVAAAGIIGNMMQEAGPSLSPEAQGTGGGGLIGWTPISAAGPKQPIITGNRQRDLQNQLDDVLHWAQQTGAGPAFMNKAKTARDAATLWMNQAEKPGIPALSNRQNFAVQVIDAAKSGNWKSGTAIAGGAVGGGGPSLSPIVTGIDSIPGFSWIGNVVSGFSGTATGVADVAETFSGFVTDFSKIIQWISWIFQPANWVRILSGGAGLVLIGLGTVALVLAVK